MTCERDGRVLFEDLNLCVGAGEMLQVTGPNGSGKTSLLRILAGLMPAASGEVRVRGGAEGLLWIGHAAGIKALLTPEENLAWLCALHRPADRDSVWRALAAVGLRGYEDVPCHTLSAGQQRRVALARLYLDAPALWILDEPFTALDRQAVDGLEAHLAEHCRQSGAVVLTTHHALTVTPERYQDLPLGTPT
ncbi:cytochrome c biogenesis ATP-binding export protein CcmA [Pseudomonas matsuisoli]|uniref:Cytochrome c biogenesis ATP-binding export protein CcmA n=1 Tax=Pseudomonas matsuisoli TaxID=1515666 RepID=A0A917Q1A1_9PSED|nr:cytochrome c biogenesis ATP-binding export protein CcmA [Pseudomonas matsuisoli]